MTIPAMAISARAQQHAFLGRHAGNAVRHRVVADRQADHGDGGDGRICGAAGCRQLARRIVRVAAVRDSVRREVCAELADDGAVPLDAPKAVVVPAVPRRRLDGDEALIPGVAWPRAVESLRRRLVYFIRDSPISVQNTLTGL